MILYFFGEDAFRSREHLKRSVDQFKKQRDPKGYNTVVIDGKKTSADKIFFEINSIPFLADKRMVVLENLLSSSDKEMLKEFMVRLEGKKIPENTVLVCWQGEALSKVKEAKELHGILAKEKYAQEFPALSGPKLSSWIQKEIKEAGAEIDLNAADQLAVGTGGDMWLLTNLISQLIAFTKKGKITSKEVSEFLEEKIDDNVFNMVDAVVSGNHKLAFKLIGEQRRKGEDDGKLFGLFLWQFRILLQMADLIDEQEHLTSDEIAKILGIHPFVAKKNFAIVRKYSLAKLQSVYRSMLEVDYKTKTGQADQSILLDLFIAKI